MAADDKSLNIFISYGRADARELALRLRDDLMAIGYRVWLDVSEIPGGASWSQQIETAIESSDVVLALMSHASYDSQWCRAEQLRATRKGKRLIPVLVQATAERPLHLEHLNHLDFSDGARYDEMFRDLLSDITAGMAFRPPSPSTRREESLFKTSRGASRRSSGEKRTAAAFRRALTKLRHEPWLGARYWWPYFLFHITGVHDVVDVLERGELRSPFAAGEAFNSRWDKFVRLDFRPRTPALYRAEGFRPLGEQRADAYNPMPVYLLFDLEAVITMDESRFCEGDPARVGKTYKGARAFRELPFDLIYHDTWFMPDERDEIMLSRAAQVLVPERLGLESLQYIWCRSPAEYETLRALLPDAVWWAWRDKISPRTDFNLFNRKWLYVEDAALGPEAIRLRFSPCADCGPFAASLHVELADGARYTWTDDALTAAADLIVAVPGGAGGYDVRFHLDDDLAYAGAYVPESSLLTPL